MIKKCYMCDSKSTSKEHVPPKCIFPESKDLEDGKDLKKNLISVPSCDEHNSNKSKDDLYLLFLLVINILSNKTGTDHFKNKVMRAAKRSPHIFTEFAKDNFNVNLVDTNNDSLNTMAIKIDRDRFDLAILHIAHALYFHQYKKTFNGEIKIITNGLIMMGSTESPEINKMINDFCITFDEMLQTIKGEGENPEVFTYKIIKINNQIYLQLNFYMNFKINCLMTHS